MAMGGIFGGLLELVNALGGGLLYVFIGSPAWREAETARWSRVVAGSIGVTILVGVAWTSLADGAIWKSGRGDNPVGCAVFLLVPALAGLEYLRQTLDD